MNPELLLLTLKVILNNQAAMIRVMALLEAQKDDPAEVKDLTERALDIADATDKFIESMGE